MKRQKRIILWIAAVLFSVCISPAKWGVQIEGMNVQTRSKAREVMTSYDEVYEELKEQTEQREQTIRISIKDYDPEEFYIGRVFYDLDKEYAKERGYYTKSGLPDINRAGGVTVFEYAYVQYPPYEGNSSLLEDGKIITSEKKWHKILTDLLKKGKTDLSFNGLYSYPLDKKDPDTSVIHNFLNQHSEYNYDLNWTITTGTGGTKISFDSETYTAGQRNTYRKKAEQKAGQIVKKIIKKGMTDREKIKSIHDYIVKNCAYDLDALKTNSFHTAYTAYGCLVKKKAVCQGYASAFNLLMQKAGLPCIGVTGRASGEEHMWNMVKLNGKIYYIDATWDDPVPDRGGKVGREYYLITKKEMQKDHSWNTELFSAKYLTY